MTKKMDCMFTNVTLTTKDIIAIVLSIISKGVYLCWILSDYQVIMGSNELCQLTITQTGVALSNYKNFKGHPSSNKNLSFFFKFLLDKCPFCGATNCSCFGLRVSFLMGFKSRVDLWPALFLACVL